MLETPHYVESDVAEIRRLVRENPWATFVSHTDSGLVASHYPVVLEEDAEGISLVSHFGRPDEVAHELGRHEVLVIIQGPHGYVSPGWYPADQIIPTWNHVTAHLHGVPEILSDEENLRVLGDLVDHFEARMPSPVSLDVAPEHSARVARGTVGLRLRVTRFAALRKLSQNKDPQTFDRIVDELDHGAQYANPALAAEMRRLRLDDGAQA